MNTLKFAPGFDGLEPKLRLKMMEWHGDNAAARYEQFAKYGGAYGVNFFDLRPALRLVTCPALVLYPDRSTIFDVEQSIAFYRALPRGELAVFPKCGHNTYEQRPEDYRKTLLDFLKRHRPDAETKERPAMSCLA
jgi:pimeloyl-ACP methyl ester carboxylesterase